MYALLSRGDFVLLQAETWVSVPYKVDALDAESLTMEAVLGAGREKGEHDSELNPHFESTHTALGIAREHMQRLRAYVAAVMQGRVPADQGLLRAIQGVANHLPGADGPDFNAALGGELVDAQVISTLAALTQAAGVAGEAMDKLGAVGAHRASTRSRMGMAGFEM